MLYSDKEGFLKKSSDTLGKMFNKLEQLPAVGLNSLSPDRTALVVVDMVNGFVREGALHSPRIEALVPEIVKLAENCRDMGIRTIAFADSHTQSSPEFSSYPVHCLAETGESELIEELKLAGCFSVIGKNSTNGFLEEEFHSWLAGNPGIDTFIVAGDCTDICIFQFTTSLKAYFNMEDRHSRVIVPVNAVETYDLGLHDRDLLHVAALYMMEGNGVELAGKIEKVL